MSPAWEALIVALWLVVTVQIWLLMTLYRQVGLVYLGRRTARTRDGLPLLSEMPNWEEVDHLGSSVESRHLAGRPLLLVFADPHCGPCQALMPDLAEFATDHVDDLSVVVVGGESNVANRQMADRYELDAPVVPDSEGKLSARFAVVATPYCYVVDHNGMIRAKGVVNNRDGLEEHIRTLRLSEMEGVR